jgi:hypothetical protein
VANCTFFTPSYISKQKTPSSPISALFAPVCSHVLGNVFFAYLPAASGRAGDAERWRLEIKRPAILAERQPIN